MRTKPMYKQLTREMLKEWGITNIYYLPEYGICEGDNSDWYIDRYWYKNNSKEKQHIRLKVCNAVCKHKYTKDKSYPIVTFSYKREVICLPLSRIIYAWFNGEVTEGLVVDHIDNNPYNNFPTNLQLLTQEENLKKRFVDNANNNVNQWTVSKNDKMHALCKKYYEEGKTYAEAQKCLLEDFYGECCNWWNGEDQ